MVQALIRTLGKNCEGEEKLIKPRISGRLTGWDIKSEILVADGNPA